MATKEIPTLPLEIIQKIAMFLPFSAIGKCMRVCKQWKVLLSSEQFCKRYLYRHYNLEDEERPSGILGTWSNNDIWACYWLDSDPYDYDDPEFWVFSDPPRRWKCGIVHLADYDLKMHKDLKYKDFLRAVYILCRIQKAADELDLDCYAWDNQNDGPIEVCLFPWGKDTLPTADDILVMFNFHPEMHQDPMVETAVEKVHVYSWDWEYNGVEKRNFLRWNTLQTYKADPKLACRFYEWLEKIFSSMVRVGIGCHSMNPFPCFMLTHVAPGWVGGILSCAERTY